MMQNELFYSYIDDSDKELMAIEAAADIEINKSLLALEYADRLYDIKLMQADLKVLNESGTFEDLDMLYEAAGKENADRKEGIVKSIWNKVLKFLNDMKTAVGNLFTKKKMSDLEKVDGNTKIKDPNKVLSTVKNAVSSVGRFLKPGVTVTNEDGEKVVSITKTLVTTIEGIGLTTIAVKTVPGLVVKAQSFGNDLIKKVEDIKNNPPKGNGINALVQFFKTCADKVSEIVKSIWKAISGFFKKDKAEAVSGEVIDANGNPADIQRRITGSKQKALPDKGTLSGSPLRRPVQVAESADDMGILESDELEESCDDIMNSIDAILA